jgi:hypothetical protein
LNTYRRIQMTGLRSRGLVATVAFVLGAAGCAEGRAAEPELVVYQTPTCGCCGGWADHMRESGFNVEVVMRNDLSGIRRELGVPPEAVTCHVGVVGGFAVEGHVPADVVHRLLRERPDVVGITAPGMPVGSPGMERADGHREPYAIYTFNEAGAVAVYDHRE